MRRGRRWEEDELCARGTNVEMGKFPAPARQHRSRCSCRLPATAARETVRTKSSTPQQRLLRNGVHGRERARKRLPHAEPHLYEMAGGGSTAVNDAASRTHPAMGSRGSLHQHWEHKLQKNLMRNKRRLIRPIETMLHKEHAPYEVATRLGKASMRLGAPNHWLEIK